MTKCKKQDIGMAFGAGMLVMSILFFYVLLPFAEIIELKRISKGGCFVSVCTKDGFCVHLPMDEKQVSSYVKAWGEDSEVCPVPVGEGEKK